MSANDSASLIDSPKASSLGLHRALYFNEREGTLETFRPYAMPDVGWVEEEWGKEIAKRVDRIKNGTAKGRPAEDVLGDLTARLQ